MKSSLMTLVIAAAFVPALALAETPSTGAIQQRTIGSDVTVDETMRPAPAKDKGFFSGLVEDIKTETTTITTHHNARSDTEFSANKPDPVKDDVKSTVSESRSYR